MNSEKNRIAKMIMLGEEINKMEGKMEDIRYRDWLKYDSKISQAVLYILNAENILSELDEFSMENDQCYPEIETIYNKIASLRAELLEYVDKNPDILGINNNNFNK